MIITIKKYETVDSSTHTSTNNQQTINKQSTNNQQQYNNKKKYKKNKKGINNHSLNSEKLESYIDVFESKSLFKN